MPLLFGEWTFESHYPIAGVAIGKEAKVRPFGILPSDLCLAPDRFVILAKPKRGSRLAYITIDNAVVHDTTFSVPDNEPRTVVGYFVKEGKQILMLSEVGKGAHIKVVRGNTELRAGDEVLPGDRLVVDVTDRSTVKSLRINGHRFAPGDEWLVQGSGDVLVELITTTKNKFNEKLAGAPLLQCEVIGGGSVKATAKIKNNVTSEFTSGQLLYADSVWDGIPPYCDQITLTPKPQKDYRCVKFEVNGEEKGSGGVIYTVGGKDVYVRAIFVKETDRPALVVHTEGATGYVDVIDAATGQRLEEGTILKEGQRLRIQARGSSSEGSRVTEISVNGTPYAANGAVSWAKEVTVSADDSKKDAFRVVATFEKATVQPPTPGTQPVLHIVKGKGVEDVKFFIDFCGENGARGTIYEIWNDWPLKNEDGGTYFVIGSNDRFECCGKEDGKGNYWFQIKCDDYVVSVFNGGNKVVSNKEFIGNNRVWGPIDKSKDVYIYIRKKDEKWVPITMVQLVDGKPSRQTTDGIGLKYDQVNGVKWDTTSISGKLLGSVPHGAVLEYGCKAGVWPDGAGTAAGAKLVRVIINDSLAVEATGREGEDVLGKWSVPMENNDTVRIVTVWRKEKVEQRTLTYASRGNGKLKVFDTEGKPIANGAVIAMEMSAVKVSTKVDVGYRLKGIDVNGRFIPFDGNLNKKEIAIPQERSVFIEAIFVPEGSRHNLLVSVLGEPKPVGEVEVIRGTDRLPTGAEVKGEDVLAITARPAAGMRLAQLRVNGELFQNGDCYIVPSDRDVVVEATFVQEDGYALFVEQEGEGEVVVERKSAAQGMWKVIDPGDAINSGDEIRVKATAGADCELHALYINQRNQHGAESGKYTEGMAVGQGNIYVRAIFKKASDTERRLYIVTTPGGYVTVAADGKKIQSGEAIDKAVEQLTVSSSAFPGNRAVLLQVNGVNHESGASYSVPAEGDVYVEARFVPSHRIVLAIEVQNSALGGDVVVADAQTGDRLYDGAQLQEGQTIRVEVAGMGQAAQLPVPEVSGPARRQSSGANTWVVEGSDGVVYVRVAFAKEYYTVKFDKGDYGVGIMGDQLVPVGIRTKLHLNQFTANGYRFVGWKDEKDQNYPDGETV